MSNVVGAAFTVYFENLFIYDFKINLHSKNSIYQAELVAIKHAVNVFINSGFTKVVIFTDSRASYMVLQRTFPINEITKDI